MTDRVSHRPSTLPSTFERLGASASRVPRLVAGVVYAAAFLNIISGLFHSFRSRFSWVSDVLPGAVTNAASALVVVAGILLLLLANALRRRKHRAWRAAVVLAALSLVLNGLRLHVALTLVSALLLYLLVRYRREFYAVGDPTTRWRALWAAVLLFVTSTAIGVMLVAVYDREVIGGWPGLWPTLQHVWLGMVGIEGDLVVRSRFDDYLAAVLLGLGLMTLLVPVFMALRAPRPQPDLSPEDDARLRSLLERSPDSLGYFNLRRDKSIIWSDSGKAAIAYRVVGGVMLASGDPIGDPEAWPGAIANFLDEAERHAWTPAVLGCSERAGTAWTRATDFAALELGDEAVVDVASFSLEGRAMRNVRQMVGRVRRAGYETDVVRVRDLAPSERFQLLADAAAWRGSETERGFSMALGRVADDLDPDAVVVIATCDGVVRGFLQFVPWGRDGISLDVMRRDRGAEAGVNELLIVSALEACRDLGVSRVSLNFAAFRTIFERGERLGAGPITRFMRSVLVFASRWFQLESLYRFNAKFQPAWVSRFLVYPGGSLPRVALASLEAEAFLTWPKMRILGVTDHA
ncbi:membrane protein [Intrasporangium oryzae NRRL B-24470]|uniref:Membrane protein n=1 Tax=Intrasporangium oryzae NRRL B-24470 TaxID=1386089 RepID=W9GFJ2_9MICO|nr:phosphatidylglycerol lysyltransferase domain-containing protein [Intrasporangium oryzae]EWT03583.1 membrane protein [Intrasporangium oryzae NRRL B-24470]